MKPKHLYTIKSASQRLQVSHRHLRRFLQAIGIEPVQLELPSGAHQCFFLFSANQMDEIEQAWNGRLENQKPRKFSKLPRYYRLA